MLFCLLALKHDIGEREKLVLLQEIPVIRNEDSNDSTNTEEGEDSGSAIDTSLESSISRSESQENKKISLSKWKKEYPTFHSGRKI